MKLLPDWKWVLKRAWSLRFIELAILLGIIAGVLSLIMPEKPPMWLIFAAPAADALAWGARLIAQKRTPTVEVEPWDAS